MKIQEKQKRNSLQIYYCIFNKFKYFLFFCMEKDILARESINSVGALGEANIQRDATAKTIIGILSAAVLSSGCVVIERRNDAYYNEYYPQQVYRDPHPVVLVRPVRPAQVLVVEYTRSIDRHHEEHVKEYYHNGRFHHRDIRRKRR